MQQTDTDIVTGYFQAKNAHDVNAMVSCFHPEAVVHDTGEGLTIEGAEAIREWTARVAEQYKLHVEVKDVSERDGQTVVTTSTSGNFPGSPIEFIYRLRLGEGHIAEMWIE